MTSLTQTPPSQARSYWPAVACGFAILAIGLGVRQSFGIFLKPVSAELHVGREVFSLGTALSMLLMGAFAPLVGRIADRFGSAPTIAGGAFVYVLGMTTMAMMHGEVLLIVGNVLSGVGLAAASFSPVLGAIIRVAPKEKQGLAMGICSAGGSFGQFFIVPLAAALQRYFGDWRPTMWVLVGLAALMLLLAMGLNDRSQIAAGHRAGGHKQGSMQAIKEAFGQRSYVLLVVGFFVCGFHVAFVGSHLPAYVSDKGVGLSLFGVTLSPAELGGWSIGMVGLFNIAGSILWSTSAAKHQRKNLLALLYFLRSLVFLAFVLAPLSAFSVLAFAGALGFLWLGTVPLTNGLVGLMFGQVHVTMLTGFVFLGHQVGSFLGGWGGGLLFDLTGGYDAMWWISIALGLVSALLHLPIVEKPVARPMLAPA
jgi:MFS family permease